MVKFELARIGQQTSYWFPPDEEAHAISEADRARLSVMECFEAAKKPVLVAGGLVYLGVVHPQVVDECRVKFDPWPQPCEDAAELGRGLGSTATSSAHVAVSGLMPEWDSTAPEAYRLRNRSDVNAVLARTFDDQGATVKLGPMWRLVGPENTDPSST